MKQSGWEKNKKTTILKTLFSTAKSLPSNQIANPVSPFLISPSHCEE
jgi:hypothetical protein